MDHAHAAQRRGARSTMNRDSASCASSTVMPCRSSSHCTDHCPRRSFASDVGAQAAAARTSARARSPARYPMSAAPDRLPYFDACSASRSSASVCRGIGDGRASRDRRACCWAASACTSANACARSRSPSACLVAASCARSATAALLAAARLRRRRRGVASAARASSSAFRSASFASHVLFEDTPRRRAPPCSRCRPRSPPGDRRDPRRRRRRTRPAPRSPSRCPRVPPLTLM